MKRSIYKDLVLWANRNGHKPLVLLGARQVGKTYILQDFGNREFSNVVYLNCHKEDRARRLFRNLDANRIIHELEVMFETDVVDGQTLVIFDEIQEVPNGLAALKYFCEDRPLLHVAAAGSLLGLSLKEDESYPVGKIETLRMYPMSFLEFLEARGKSKLKDCLSSLAWETLAMHHDTLSSLLREYFFTGGMPEVVNEYIQTGDIRRVRSLQAEIIDAYMRDIAKHSKTLTQRIHLVWDSIPGQLARENKKFIFGALKKGARSADFELALQWLADAGLIYIVKKVKTVSSPLKFYADNSAFKVYLADCGLLACMCHAPANEMLTGDSPFIEFKGAFSENYVLQQLRVQLDTDEIFYFAKDNSTQEIDFLLQTGHRIIPMEVKAAENVKSKSLSGFINTDNAGKGLKGLRVSMKNHIDQGWMENIPLYAVEAYISKEKQMNEQ